MPTKTKIIAAMINDNDMEEDFDKGDTKNWKAHCVPKWTHEYEKCLLYEENHKQEGLLKKKYD
jgi:hypothetical protein